MIDRVRSEDSAMTDASRSLSSIIDNPAASLGYTHLKVSRRRLYKLLSAERTSSSLFRWATEKSLCYALLQACSWR